VTTVLENTSIGASREQLAAEPTLRRTLFRLLEAAEEHDTASRMVDLFLVTMITLSVIAVVLESMASIEQAYGTALHRFEVFTVTVFTIEFCLRIWVSIEADPSLAAQPVRQRLRFLFSFHAVIDFLAILPFYLLASGVFGMIDLRFLRAIRLLRILKLTRYFSALNLLFHAIRENSRALGASFLILLTIMLLAASGMYYFERTSQPEDFGSIPAAMWWAFATLTTVGYGDVTPITVGGKIFGALMAVVGIGMVALPTSILASGYSEQLRINTEKYRSRAKDALEDGVLDDEELRDLEDLRMDLGLGKLTTTQILDEGMVRSLLQADSRQHRCPHCHEALPLIS
jgi:voltage-gated potassium channel